MKQNKALSLVILLTLTLNEVVGKMNIVVNTWPFTRATDAAWNELTKSGDPMLAIEAGCTAAENDMTIPTVGFGGSPDEKGNVTLDAMIMNGNTMEVGSVAAMPHVKNAIKVAHYVLKYSRHTLLVGESASEFAREMGFKWETLENDNSSKLYHSWLNARCQPNFRRNVLPDPHQNCGPYKPIISQETRALQQEARPAGTVDEEHHDTIGMLVLSPTGMAAGTSTNGAIHRIPGRVGDSAIVGAGAYVDSDVGAAAGTGDGDILMRFVLALRAVENMRSGMDPTKAATLALNTVKQKGTWSGALVTLNNKGEFGGACVGFSNYYISVRSQSTSGATVTHKIECLNLS